MIDNNPKYKYIGTSTDPKDQTFDKEHYLKLLNSKDYEGARDYRNQYPLLNPIEEMKARNNLDNMIREARREEFLYKNTDESYHPILEFKNAVEIDGGLDRLSNDNEYGNKFKEYKDAIGSGESRIRIRFEPEQQKLFGIDWLKKDNTNANINSFYEKTGYNKRYLKDHDVDVITTNGYTYLEFDKSNPLANTILLNAPSEGSYQVQIQGVKGDGKYTKSDDMYLGGNHVMSNLDYLVGYNPNALYNVVYGDPPLKAMQKLYKDASDLETKIYEEYTPEVFESSSMYFPMTFDAIAELQNKYDEGNIKPSGFKTQRDLAIVKLIKGIAGSGIGQYDIYSNNYNDDGTSTNYKINDQEKQKELLEKLEKADIKKLNFGVIITNNTVGFRIRIPGKDKTQNTKAEDSVEFTIFGDDIQASLQKEINNDPKMKAYQEVFDMELYGYVYEDCDGNTYENNGRDTWRVKTKDGENVADKDWVIDKIQKDIQIKELARAVIIENTSMNGKIINPKKYDDQLKLAANFIANDLNPNGDIIEALKQIYGKKDYKDYNDILTDLFKIKGLGDRVSDEYEDLIPGNILPKINQIYEIYTSLLNYGNNFTN